MAKQRSALQIHDARSGYTLSEIVFKNVTIFAISIGVFMAAAVALYYLMPKGFTSRSTVRVLNAPFDFQTLATSRDVAQTLADRFKIPGGADAVQEAISVDPIVPRFVYSNTYSDLLAITVVYSSKDLAEQMNLALISAASERYQKIEGHSYPITVIDSPYVSSRHGSRTILAYIVSAAVLGFAVGLGWVWIRQRGAGSLAL